MTWNPQPIIGGPIAFLISNMLGVVKCLYISHDLCFDGLERVRTDVVIEGRGG